MSMHLLQLNRAAMAILPILVKGARTHEKSNETSSH